MRPSSFAMLGASTWMALVLAACFDDAPAEVCDGIDNDHDGQIDEDVADAPLWYSDVDHDGYGNGAAATRSCSQPRNTVKDTRDCNDAIAGVHPGAVEVCDGVDQDCDGSVDEDATDQKTWYADTDGDGYGNTSITRRACTAPAGFVGVPGDCADRSAVVHPGAPELCDNADNDCDGAVDEGALLSWYQDRDGDGYGVSTVVRQSCVAPRGFVGTAGDCVDRDASIHPGSAESCDGVDDDCDGAVDEDPTGAPTWYADADGDGFGDATHTISACTRPAGYVTSATDCLDSDATAHPGAAEACDGVDDDCNGAVDDHAADAPTWYADSDGDGFGNAGVTVAACAAPSGFVADATDCSDGASGTHPGAVETCDGVDQDCDGSIDESAADAGTFYADVDGDGYGDPSVATQACAAPAGWVTDATDCGDADSGRHPDADEYCDGVDQDCDGAADEDAIDAPVWHADNDGDGFGDGSSSYAACSAPAGFLADASDCADDSASVHPGAAEACDGVDQDCDGLVDGPDTDHNGLADVCSPVVDPCDQDGDGYSSCTIAAAPSVLFDLGHGEAADLDDYASATGWGEATDALVAAGYDWTDSSGELTPELLAGHDVLVVAEPLSTFSEDEIQAVFGWVEGGGSLLLLASFADEAVNPLAEPMGVRFLGSSGAIGSVGVEEWSSDAEVAAGVSRAFWPYASSFEVQDPDVDAVVYESLGARGSGEGSHGGSSHSGGHAGPAHGGSSHGGGHSGPAHGGSEHDGHGGGSDDEGDDEGSDDHDSEDHDSEDHDSEDHDSEGHDSEDHDSEGHDSGGSDSGTSDSGTSDSGASDSGASDSGSPDSGSSDSGSPDSGLTDTGAPDSGTPDSGSADSGLPDPGDLAVVGSYDGHAVYATRTLGAGRVVFGSSEAAFSALGLDGMGDDASASRDNLQLLVDTFGWLAPVSPTETSLDCDDADAGAHPGAVEVCDGVDQDCDGVADDDAADASTWYTDLDGDGFGGGEPVVACTEPEGAVSDDSDCDDADAATFPGAPELCDSLDNSCDGVVDEGLPDADANGTPDCLDTEICDGIDNDGDGEIDEDVGGVNPWYADADGDGYGDGTVVVTSCQPPAGFVDNADDCDDASASAFPGAAEACNGVDDDCDGYVDDNTSDRRTWYADVDGDGVGGADYTTVSCSAPEGYVSSDNDCDDLDATIFPGAVETCDGIDQDCDGEADNGATDGPTWYVDTDGDGYGDGEGIVSCPPIEGRVDQDGDCDDADPTRSPGITEVCDGIDQDCDGEVDDNAADSTIYWADADGDGYGDAQLPQRGCTVPEGTVSVGGDCVDVDASISPSAVEICDGIDNDCTGTIDDHAVDALTFHADSDGDGYGDPDGLVLACEQGAGMTTDTSDCDDTSGSIWPGAVETCDGLDDDCDGSIDEDANDASVYYTDADGDGHGSAASPVEACSVPDGAADSDDDCDDTNADIRPGVDELCDGVDQDCDGSVDEEATDAPTWYADADGDGYGDRTVRVQACSAPAGYVADSTDCADGSAEAHAGGSEVCNGIDDDCDGEVDESSTDATAWHPDVDGDGYGDANVSVLSCSAPAGYMADGSDCDDATDSVSPDAVEVCNGIDDDCDGTKDRDAADAVTWYMDNDADTYGDPDTTTLACNKPAGYVADATDCDDSRDTTNPAAAETCDNRDNDCDGSVDDGLDFKDYYLDADFDRYGDASVVVSACRKPGGYSLASTDCDDSNADVHPGAAEVCNSIDDDCDGEADGTDEVAWTNYYVDGDSDGFGSPDVAPTYACKKPRGHVADATDCDDGRSNVNPEATEYCDGLDNNCDGSVDQGAVDDVTWYADSDGDGYGDPDSTTLSCLAPEGYVGDSSDCDDDKSGIKPGAAEACNGIDDDCDGSVDEDATKALTTYYRDADADGYGASGDKARACSLPDGYATVSGDCDDANADASPDGVELCNGVDDNCSGVIDESTALDASDWYHDADTDGYGDATSVRVACEEPDHYVSDATDCDDDASTSHPGGVEVCNGADDDCNGSVDDGTTTGGTTWYADTDGDGFGTSTMHLLACAAPSGFVADGTDCNDHAVSVYPGASETCNSIDDDCDGTVDDSAVGAPTWYADSDRDGYGTSSTSTVSCTAPSGYVSAGSDCNDASASVSPAAAEVCGDNIDNNCDGENVACGPYGYKSVTSADATLTGVTLGDGAGYSLAPAGDVDGDGFADMLVGAYAADPSGTNSGSTYLVRGPMTSGSLSTAAATFTGEHANDYSGQSVAGGGDVNGDGYLDLLVGAYNESSAATRAGAAYVAYGPFSGTRSLGSGQRFTGTATEQWTGYAVAMLPDEDGDGRADLLIGSPYDGTVGTKSGAAWIVTNPTGSGSLTSSSDAKLIGEVAGDRAATAVASAGDVDGDGISDLLVGAWGNSSAGSRAGAAYLLYGPVTGNVSLSTADATWRGEAANDRAGVGLSGAGDVNGDGTPDLLIGGYQSSKTWVVTNVSAGVHSLSTANAKFTPENSADAAGWAVSGGGDIDGSGTDDIVIGAYLRDHSVADTGTTYVVLSPFSGTVALSTVEGRLYSSGQYDYAGYAVAGLGDTDGDGLSDIAIGAYGVDTTGSSAGAVYVFRGAE